MNEGWTTGSCLCGAVSYEIRPPFSFFQYCLVPAGTLDGDPGAMPERSIHWASRAPWFVAVGDLPIFDEGRR